MYPNIFLQKDIEKTPLNITKEVKVNVKCCNLTQNLLRYLEIWLMMFNFNSILILMAMFARSLYVRYATGLVEKGTKLLNILLFICVAIYTG